MLLRLEGSAAFAAAVALYGHAGFSWPIFALLFLSPGPVDARLSHRTAGGRGGLQSRPHLPAGAGARARGIFREPACADACGLIWIAHIGLDRALGYGLKYSTGFGDTHLGRIGRR